MPTGTPEDAEDWNDDLLDDHHPFIERAIGMKIDRRLGCGAWGCVYETDAPWVVKFTLDPPEPHVWALVMDVVRGSQSAQAGVVRVRNLYQLEPPIEIDYENWTVFAVVREAVHPVFKRGRKLTDFTVAKVGLPEEDFVYSMPGEHVQVQRWGPRRVRLSAPSLALHMGGLDAEQRESVRDFEFTVQLLGQYKNAARSLIHRRDPRDTEHMRLLLDELRRLEHGRGLAQTLDALGSRGVWLADLHRFNIGWRANRRAPGFANQPETIVVFDVGATAVEPVEIPFETRRFENPII